MDRRTLLRRIGAASGGMVAASGAVTAVDGTDLQSVEPGDEVVVDGRRVEVIENPAGSGPQFADVTGSGETLCCCGPSSSPCSVICEEENCP